MSAPGKKVSFSFSKVKKPSISSRIINDTKEKIEYVDSFDGAKGTFSYKGNVRNEKPVERELVIPLITSVSSNDIAAKIEERAQKLKEKNNSHASDDCKSSSADSSCCNLTNHVKSLDEIAAREILNDVKNGHNDKSDPKVVVIGQDISEKETPDDSVIDYEQVPVSDFGLAMLRGMGWKPDYGIGKEPRLVPTVSPKLRPKGLGLGAKPKIEEEDKDQKRSEKKNSDKKHSKA